MQYNSGDDLQWLEPHLTDTLPNHIVREPFKMDAKRDGMKMMATEDAFQKGLDEKYRGTELIHSGRFIPSISTPIGNMEFMVWELKAPDGVFLYLQHIRPAIDDETAECIKETFQPNRATS
ncbi:MAG TPA: hypothetical protein VKU00_14930 [Chthonomonadaceae bacterium]|nr:hypothetical protein [Chthonomonadaceae bacterium]